MGSTSPTCRPPSEPPQPRPPSRERCPLSQESLWRHPLLLAQFSFLPTEAGAAKRGRWGRGRSTEATGTLRKLLLPVTPMPG